MGSNAELEWLTVEQQCKLFGSDLIDLLRREGRFSRVWFADKLLQAADLIERAALTRPSPIAGDVVERVARAIFSATSEWTQSHDNWDAMPDYGQDVFRDRARAAVSAMPTIEALQERVKVLEGHVLRAASLFEGFTVVEEVTPEFLMKQADGFRAALSTQPTGGGKNGQ